MGAGCCGPSREAHGLRQLTISSRVYHYDESDHPEHNGLSSRLRFQQFWERRMQGQGQGRSQGQGQGRSQGQAQGRSQGQVQGLKQGQVQVLKQGQGHTRIQTRSQGDQFLQRVRRRQQQDAEERRQRRVVTLPLDQDSVQRWKGTFGRQIHPTHRIQAWLPSLSSSE